MIYEIMYIVPARYSETEVEGVMQAVQGYIEKHGGKVEKAENLGRMKFAYTIKKNTHGTYVLLYAEIAGEAVAKIDLELRSASSLDCEARRRNPDVYMENDPVSIANHSRRKTCV